MTRAVIYDGDDELELRRVGYDHRGAADRMRSQGGRSEAFARRIELAST